jgi:tetratricopeptide (TPR) repeat protein
MEIKPICEALQLTNKQCNQDSLVVSFVTVNEAVSSQQLNQLESSFMYTQNSSAPFASIREVSHFQTEEEVLFSMHTVFRIGEITRIDNNISLYQVELTLTSDDDQQLYILTERNREETSGEKGWGRSSVLLIKIEQFDKAEEVYNVLLEQTSNRGKKVLYNHNLGTIKVQQGDYKTALEIWQKTILPYHPFLATLYSSIDSVYKRMGDYWKALSFYQEVLEVCNKILAPNYPDLTTYYDNVALVYNNMRGYPKVFSLSEKVLEMRQNNTSFKSSCVDYFLQQHRFGVYEYRRIPGRKQFHLMRKPLRFYKNSSFKSS